MVALEYIIKWLEVNLSMHKSGSWATCVFTYAVFRAFSPCDHDHPATRLCGVALALALPSQYMNLKYQCITTYYVLLLELLQENGCGKFRVIYLLLPAV